MLEKRDFGRKKGHPQILEKISIFERSLSATALAWQPSQPAFSDQSLPALTLVLVELLLLLSACGTLYND